MSASEAAGLVDGLYRRAIETPDAIQEPLLVEWLEQAAEAVRGDGSQLKALRKAIRTARKLSRYWLERDAARLPDWRNGVDEGLGGKGWQCQLDLVMNGLMESPNLELFEEAKERHRAVHFTEWMEGVAFEEWAAQAPRGQ